MSVSKNVGVYSSGAMLGAQRQRVKQVSGFDFGAILSANATYAWWADTLPASGATGNWTDYVSGVVATATGAPQVGELGGRRAAVFAGTQRYTTAAFAVAVPQPFAVVAVAQRTGAATTQTVFHNLGISAASRSLLRFGATFVTLYAGSSELFGTSDNSVPLVLLGGFNSASSYLRRNGVQIASGDVGTAGATGVNIGSNAAGFEGLTGKAALIAVVAPNAAILNDAARLADVIARAAAIEAAAMSYYNI